MLFKPAGNTQIKMIRPGDMLNFGRTHGIVIANVRISEGLMRLTYLCPSGVLSSDWSEQEWLKIMRLT